MATFPNKNTTPAKNLQSIDGKLKSLIRQMIIPFTVMLILVIGLFIVFMLQYSRVSSNITTASRFNHNFKDEVDLKMYTFVSGSSDKLPFEEVETARNLAETLQRATGNREAHRTIQSVLNLCDNLHDSIIQIREAVGYDERMQQLESNIYVITELIEEYIYTYLYIREVLLSALQPRLMHCMTAWKKSGTETCRQNHRSRRRMKSCRRSATELSRWRRNSTTR